MTGNGELSGVLPVDKPPGPTSHDAVAAARRALGIRRVGHSGTLDPFASGLLLLCVGPATRLAEYLGGLPKTYRAVMRLGEQTDTDDPTGTVIAASEEWRAVSREQVESALGRRGGRQMQIPPAYSAKKRGGERLYEKARRGEFLAPSPVVVEVLNIRLTSWDPPLAGFETTCSSGTYVRAIARDAGADLQVYAHLTELRRTAIGPHRVESAIQLAELREGRWRDAILTPAAALPHLPCFVADDRAAGDIRHGRPIAAPAELRGSAVLVLHGEELVAVGDASDGWIRPRKVFDA